MSRSYILVRLMLFIAMWCGGSACITKARADAPRPVHIIGRAESLVTTRTFSLGDIASISSSRSSDDEAVIGLKKIPLHASPAPGKVITLTAMEVLSKLRDAGVDLDQVGYTLPRIMTVHRASRTLTLEEITATLKDLLRGESDEVELQEVQMPSNVQVAPGELTLRAKEIAHPAPGKRMYSVAAEVPGVAPIQFDVRAVVHEWREIPIAKRAMGKGEVIQRDDLARARINLSQLPRDTVLEDTQIVGLEVQSPIGFGDVFRKNSLNIPPAIAKGGRVTLLVKSGSLEVTAKGIALHDAAVGDEARVRNESSQKIISGKVVSDGMIEVLP